MDNIYFEFLGQSSVKIVYNTTVIYIDPYFSNSLEFTEGEHLKRLVPIPSFTRSIKDASIVLISHIHQDHCDIKTLDSILKNSKEVYFIGPRIVCDFLISNGFPKNKVVHLSETYKVTNEIKVSCTLAAHPEIEFDQNNYSKYIGFIIDIDGYKIYHSGDTLLNDEVLNCVKTFKPINVSCLPINEDNYMKRKAGIIGNMSIRDALYFSEILEVEKMIPLHWDMFQLNYVSQEEFNIVLNGFEKNFKVIFNPKIIINQY
jgi:L-ascorbate 6-phosphate lactonase